MKLLVDMNLSPRWVDYLKAHGYEVLHWSETGAPDAAERTIMQWAKENGCVVFTHDLDFSALLAATQADGPSVLQVRAQDVLPEAMERRYFRCFTDSSLNCSPGRSSPWIRTGRGSASCPLEPEPLAALAPEACRRGSGRLRVDALTAPRLALKPPGVEADAFVPVH